MRDRYTRKLFEGACFAIERGKFCEAMLWMDGMDRYGTITDIDLFYSRAFTLSYSPTNGINGGGCIETTTGWFTKTFDTAGALTAGGVVHAFMNYRAQSLPSANQFMVLGTNLQGNGQNSNAPSLSIDSTGALRVNAHGSSTVIATSPAGIIATGVYYRIEYKAKYETFANGGYIKVYVNGNIVVDTTLLSSNTVSGTVPSTFTSVSLGCIFVNHTQRFDDVVFWDESGTDFTTSLLSGSWLPYIETRSVNANDAVQWTPLSSTNASNVDDPAYNDGDTTYNSDTTVGHQDSFTVPSQAGGANATFAVSVKLVAKIDIAGTINLRSGIIVSGTPYESGNFLLTTAYRGLQFNWGKNPNTVAAWAATGADAIKPLYKYQS